MKHLFTLSLVLIILSCHSQDKSKHSPTRLNINKERSDSLARHVPPARDYVNDFAGLYSLEEIKKLDTIISEFEQATTAQIAIATLDTNMVKDKDFEDYTLVMMRTWGVGVKGKNNGILIGISPDLRRIRIQNGYGIENYLSDEETKKIIDNVIIPKFRDSKYFEGTRDGINAIIAKLKQNDFH